MAEESVEEKQRNNFKVGGEYYIPGTAPTWYMTRGTDAYVQNTWFV